MNRWEFVIIFISAQFALEFVFWLFGAKFDVMWLVANCLLIPACGLLMPDNNSKECSE